MMDGAVMDGVPCTKMSSPVHQHQPRQITVYFAVNENLSLSPIHKLLIFYYIYT